MLGLKKEANSIEVGELKVTNCPICHSYVCHQYFMQDATTKKSSKWFACSCGVVFQATKPKGIYDRKYWDDRSKYNKKLEASFSYPVKMYSPIIEELIYGRRVLIIGRPNYYQEEELARRGWVPTVIDKNTCFETKGNLIAGDFETYQFPERVKYNMIWIYHTLECFSDPIASLELCKTLLAEDGIIFIGTPDTDFINIRSSSCFIHWKPDYNHIMWNKRALTKQMESMGFNTIMCRSNYEYRFPFQDDIHGIFQRRFF